MTLSAIIVNNYYYFPKKKIFGAFVNGNLTDRHNNTFFGSGETFLFSLQPEKERYYWTGESDLILRANDEEMIIGSGGRVRIIYKYPQNRLVSYPDHHALWVWHHATFSGQKCYMTTVIKTAPTRYLLRQ